MTKAFKVEPVKGNIQEDPLTPVVQWLVLVQRESGHGLGQDDRSWDILSGSRP